MKLYNGIIIYDRDNHLAQTHLKSLAKLGKQMEHCFYYGMDSHPAEGITYCVVDIEERYENLPMKTYCMFKHALKFEWDRFLKTDANAKVHSVKWDIVKRTDLTGFLAVTPESRIGGPTLPVFGGRVLNRKLIHQPALGEPYLGPQSEYWVGGPAYIVSRRLAEAVVQRGIWAARAFAAEDMMVSTVAMQHSMTIEAGVGYISDTGRLDINKWR